MFAHTRSHHTVSGSTAASMSLFKLFPVVAVVALVVSATAVQGAGPSPISVFVSDNAGARLESRTAIQWKTVEDELAAAGGASIRLDTHKHYQKFDGVGGSFMRAGATVLNKMPADVQENILRDLFHPTEGAGFVLGKVPIGATDFGVPEWYTYADTPTPTDSSLPEFTMQVDLDPTQGIIPFVQRAQKMAGRRLRLEATLDYLPAWMLDSTVPMPAAELNATLMSSIANYYLKYALAMKDNDVPCEFLSLFNELTDSYMNASYENTHTLLVNYVAPLFKAHPGSPKLTWTEKFGRRVTLESSPSFYEMPGVQAATEAIFYHGYDCNYGPAEGLGWQCNGFNTTCPYLAESSQMMRQFYEQYGHNRTLWMTELCYASEFGDYQVANGCAALPRLDFQDSMQWGAMMFADFNIIQASGWIYWNLILDTTGGPWLISPEHNDPDPNEQQPVLVADPTTGKYYLTGGYYALAHFGRYVSTDSVRVEATSHGVSSQLSSIAFFDAKKSVVTMVLMNDDVSSTEFSLILGKQTAKVTVPAISFTTLQFHL
jgi:glucosylceramidase